MLSFHRLFITIIFLSLICAGYTQSNSDSIKLIIQENPGENILLHDLYSYLVKDACTYQLSEAAAYLDSSLHYANKTEDKERIAQSLGYYAIYYRIIGNISNAEQYSKLSLTRLGDLKDSPTYALNLFNLGSLAMFQGNYDEAVKYFIDCLKIDEANENWIRVGEAYNNISLIYKETGDPKSSINYLYKSKYVFEEHASDQEIALANYNLAATYLELNEFDSVIHYGQLTNKIGVKTNNKDVIGIANQIISIGLTGKKRYNEAKEHALIALETHKDLPLSLSKIQTYIALGIAQSNLGEYGKAEDNLLTSLRLAKEVDYVEGQNLTRQYLSEHYARTKEYDKAYDNLLVNRQHIDSISSIQNKQIINDLNLKYETSKKDAQIKEQELEIVQKTNQRNTYLFILGLLAMLALVLLGRFRYNKKLSNEKIRRLRQQQKLIALDHMLQGQEEERERVAKELHDGLGGLLATAKLQLQRNKSSEMNATFSSSEAEEIIDNAYSELRRISHDMMPNALSNLGLKSAVEDLADKINSSNQLKVITQFMQGDMAYSKSTQIALYRIIQESLNNIIKHAQAKEVIIQLTKSSDGSHLTIEDDGIGFDQKEITNGIGLKSIKSRVAYLGGTLNIESIKDQGTSLDILIPTPK